MEAKGSHSRGKGQRRGNPQAPGKVGSAPGRGTKEPTPPEWRPPGLIPDHIRDAADRLAQGNLGGVVIERQHSADDPKIVPFLEALQEGDDTRALKRLSTILSDNPQLLEHPYVWDQLRHLFQVFSPSDPDLPHRAQEWLCKLIQAWATSMSLGKCKVTILPPKKARRGRAPKLFPNLHDADGWLPTDGAHLDTKSAIKFRHLYDDLMARLEHCLRWKAVRNQFVSALDGHHYAAVARILRDAANAIGPVFEGFRTERHLAAEPLSETALQPIVRESFDERRGGNPRRTVACGLLATLPARDRHGNAVTLNTSLVGSTLDTLAKQGIRSDTFSRVKSRPNGAPRPRQTK